MHKAMNQELIELVLKYAESTGYFSTPLGSLKISRSDHPTEPIHTVYTPTLCFMVQGAKDVVVGDILYHYTPKQCLITSAELPAIGQVTEASPLTPYLCIVLELDERLVYELMEQIDLPKKKKTAVKGIFLENVDINFTEAMLRLMRALGKPNDIQVLTPLILREITYILLTAEHGHIISQLAISGSNVQRIAQVVTMIRKQYAEPLTMELLVKKSGMSTSAFYHHFKEITTMSPLKYLKQIRLQQARQLLILGETDAAGAGYEVGYGSPSQFSREYSRMFGAPPIRDIKRLRRVISHGEIGKPSMQRWQESPNNLRLLNVVQLKN